MANMYLFMFEVVLTFKYQRGRQRIPLDKCKISLRRQESVHFDSDNYVSYYTIYKSTLLSLFLVDEELFLLQAAINHRPKKMQKTHQCINSTQSKPGSEVFFAKFRFFRRKFVHF